MKKWQTILLVALLGLTLVGSAAVVYAQQGDTPPRPLEAAEAPPPDAPPLDQWPQGDPPPAQGNLQHQRPARGLRGEVTAVHETGFSLLTRGEQAVEVTVHSGTKIWLVETQSQGTLERAQLDVTHLVQTPREAVETLQRSAGGSGGA